MIDYVEMLLKEQEPDREPEEVTEIPQSGITLWKESCPSRSEIIPDGSMLPEKEGATFRTRGRGEWMREGGPGAEKEITSLFSTPKRLGGAPQFLHEAEIRENARNQGGVRLDRNRAERAAAEEGQLAWSTQLAEQIGTGTSSEKLYERLRQRHAAALYAAHSPSEASRSSMVEKETTGALTWDAAALDRVFQRDARRYDGAFPLY